MYAAERHERLAELLREDGRLAVADVADMFGVSGETVRRDLAVLERHGIARRVHGGAVAAHGLRVLEPGLGQRNASRVEAKNRIAEAALAFLPPAEGSIALDAGTTLSQLADRIPTDRDLTVVTHAVPIAAKLTGAPGIVLHVLGGRVRGITAASVGSGTVAAIERLQVDVAFMGTNALSPEHGLSTPDGDEAAVKAALVRCARHVVVLADSSKLDVDHLFRFAAIEDVDVLVTDHDADALQVGVLEDKGIEVVLA
ncbi:MAG: DeoR/GlpR family DNA-binding transcription regulator [Nocardioidaceae bacterium]|nr:DeoR/GlpR family DNA-binding transcription regulator [Nocardioidaceae bacterium]